MNAMHRRLNGIVPVELRDVIGTKVLVFCIGGLPSTEEVKTGELEGKADLY